MEPRTPPGVKVALGGTKAVSSNMWMETGQGNLSSYSTLGNTWVLGFISHNHPSGLSPDPGKETRALCPSQKSGPAPAIGGGVWAGEWEEGRMNFELIV